MQAAALALAAALASSVGKVLLQMIMGLASEKFIKQAVIMALQKLVNMTETEEDNKLLKAAEEIWNKPVAEPEAKPEV